MEPLDGCAPFQKMKSPWLRITTETVEDKCVRKFLRAAQRLLDAHYPSACRDDASTAETIRRILIAEAKSVQSIAQRLWAEAIAEVTVDLYEQGWRISYENKHLWGLRPSSDATREALRARFVARRDQQLSEPSVRAFVESMEAWRLFRGKRVSVITLLRDGRDLVERISQSGLNQAIRPYLQFVTPTARCEHTGLRLQDIWRYFRHTWANPYESIPGRSLQIVVRDASAPNHPIIGISAVSSAAVRLGGRDRYIGWDTEQVLVKFEKRDPAFVFSWAQSVVDDAIDELYVVDFVRDNLLPADASLWRREHCAALLDLASKSREMHHRLASAVEYKAALKGEEGWAAKAELPLFQAKRAAELASLIELKECLRRVAGQIESAPPVPLDKASLRRIIRIARSKTVGTEIADLTLCGAIAPYSHLAAGKLVAMLSVSPPVIEEYQKRYKSAAGIIASSMAGRPIHRAARLCFVGTSSLYGKRPNQYDRLAIPAPILGGAAKTFIRFNHISDATSEATRGLGTFQFAPRTLEAITRYVSAHRGGWRVKNVFGEGTSSKLRGLREGFEQLDLEPELLMTHGIEKNLYGVALASNVAEYLLAFDSDVKWLFDPAKADEAVLRISEWWTTRWAGARGSREDILLRIRRETLIHPIRHAGRVPVVRTQADDQASLFN
jgi:hypothetical protein